MWVTYGRNVPMPLPLCQGLSKVSRPLSRESKPVSKTVMTGSSSTTPTVGTGELDEPASFKFAKFHCFAHEESWSCSHATYIISRHIFLQIFGHFLDPSWWKASLRCQRHPTGSPAARWCLHGLRWTQVDRNSCAKMMSEAHLFSKSNADTKTCATLSLAYLLFLCDVFGEGTSSFTWYMPCITS